ncbi:hypothetical protein MY3296_009501 [Beauveria thailandica]
MGWSSTSILPKPKHKYALLSGNHSLEDPSTTAAEAPRPQFRRKNSSTTYLFALLAVLNVIALAALGANYTGTTSGRTHDLKFHPSHTFGSIEHIGDADWDGLLPENGGYWLDQSPHNGGWYGISMFHQLHCLQLMRMAIQTIAAPDEEAATAMEPRHEHDPSKVPFHHLGHCLDYMRQTVLCYADGTLEPPEPSDDGLGIEGYNITRHCKSSDAVYRLAEDSPIKNPDGSSRIAA